VIGQEIQEGFGLHIVGACRPYEMNRNSMITLIDGTILPTKVLASTFRTLSKTGWTLAGQQEQVVHGNGTQYTGVSPVSPRPVQISAADVR
jgi:hypothetical protein